MTATHPTAFVDAAPQAGPMHGLYPQRRRHDAAPDWADAVWRQVKRLAAPRAASQLAVAARVQGRILAQRNAAGIDRQELCRSLRKNGLDADGRELALAFSAAAAESALGQRPYPVQLAAADALLRGVFAEMATGEGKTLVIALAASCAALAGKPVHVITANDYLVTRDADTMAPLFAHLGLRVGKVRESDGIEARRAAYAADITYVTAREVVFDYLRDSVMVPFEPDRLVDTVRAFTEPAKVGQRVLRGLCMAIIDEADSVLIDEARLPLILARPRGGSADANQLATVLACARELTEGQHFLLEPDSGRIQLMPAGQAAAGLLGGDRRPREGRLQQALAALHVYARDRHYVVRDGQVRIVDTQTGRIADKRAWGQELHRFIELKEGCELGREHITAAQITYQRFFPRYLHLTGVSGTLRECAAELAAVYDRQLLVLPPHRPLRRQLGAPRVFGTRDAMWVACVVRARDLATAGRAVLIGTDSVRDSRALSAHFAEAGLPHTVLDALQDANEAAIVALAGQPGRITVSTRMAGRGTDIRLHESVRATGGLHVICCQHNSTRRTDRQLLGRSARQGDPGSAEHFRSLEADEIEAWIPDTLRRFLMRYLPRLPGLLPNLAFRFAQHRHEAHDRRLRALMLEAEQTWHQHSAYRGTGI